MSEAARAASAGTQVAASADRLSAAFYRELVRVLRDAERSVRPVLREALQGNRTAQVLAARGIGLRDDLRRVLMAAGYDGLVDRISTVAVREMTAAVLRAAVVRQATGFVRPSPTRLAALAEIGRSNLLQVGDDLAVALWRSVLQWAYTVRPVEEILDDLLLVFDDEAPVLRTLFDTQVSVFGRQVEALATAAAPADQPYLYVGPVDSKTRRWCLERVGLVVTRDVIDEMDNGQLANPFLTGGGYQCRHSWMSVQSAELRAIANTGQRAPEFAQLVASVPVRRAA